MVLENVLFLIMISSWIFENKKQSPGVFLKIYTSSKKYHYPVPL
tara:strand:+ start:234 stop:365 length:132 start_codon:yes stop_codon:yes gene_type:complete